MKKILIPVSVIFLLGLVSCKKYFDINKDPDRIAEASAPINLLLTNATVNTGFSSGSDLNRYAGLLMQQYSGQTTGGETQTQQYEKYLLQSSDVNNMWNLFYATTLNDLEVIISLATTQNAPYYRGVAKLLKAYNYHHLVDAFGEVPFSEAQQTSSNTSPKFDDGAAVYTALIKIIDEALADLNGPSTGLEPGANSTIYSGSFSTKKANWIKFGNTLKLRLLIHSSKLSLTETVAKITTLVNQSGVSFFASNADNFEMPFFNLQNRQNPIHQFDLSRANYLFPNKFLVDAMNIKSDPRRASYFSTFPFGSTTYAGAASGDAQSQKYSRIHSYLRGAATGGTANADGSTPANPFAGSITYDGTAPIRMLTFAEYNFIRAEAAVYGAPGNAQTFFQAGITASMQAAGVSALDISTYIALYGTLAGTNSEQVSQIINEKFVANFGVMQESWTDWRRTGFPSILKVSNAVTTDIPRSLPFPQSEIDANKNAPPQKPNLLVRVFWDKP
jgi:Starch-binding associating with outer membrane